MVHPAVTAVVPTHNRPELMGRAVQSILDQTYAGDIEILVIFDACEPALPDVQVPPGRELRALVNGRTRGLAGARNTGILAAKHEFVAFLDDDDVWEPAKLERQMERFAQRPAALFVGSAMIVDDGRRRHERLVPSEPVTHWELLHSRLAGLHASSFVVRRSALVGDLGLVDEAIPHSYGEDYDLLLRAAALAPIQVVNEPLVTVAWQGTSHFLGRWGDYAEALRYRLVKHPEFATSPRAIGRVEAQIAFAEAARGKRAQGVSWAWRALRRDPRQVKAWLAIAIALGVTSGDRIARLARRFGRSI